MKVLKGILSESKEYYQGLKRDIEKRLSKLPKGSVKKRVIYGSKYYYLQQRKGMKVVQKYIGKDKPVAVMRQINDRKRLEKELVKVKEALKILRRSEGRKRGTNNRKNT